MASATSYLAPSPSYHVPVRPNYILRREGESEAWRESVDEADAGVLGPEDDADAAGRGRVVRTVVSRDLQRGEEVRFLSVGERRDPTGPVPVVNSIVLAVD
jgi:hypothetical protein